jgi:hypothetical protein
MSNVSADDPIDDVADGDIIAVERESGTRPYKVVFKSAEQTAEGTVYTITFEDDDGETFQLDYPAGTRVTRTLESKWESGQSPTPHSE